MEKIIEAILNNPQNSPPSPSSSKDGGFPDCAVMMNAFTKCLGMGYQSEYIYRHGSCEDCSNFFDDWKACMHSRLVHDKDKIKGLYENTYYYKKQQLKNSNDIFIYKDKPNWD